MKIKNPLRGLRKLARSLRPTFCRFPVLFIGGLAFATVLTLLTNSSTFFPVQDGNEPLAKAQELFDDVCTRLAFASAWTMVCSLCFQLIAEWGNSFLPEADGKDKGRKSYLPSVIAQSAAVLTSIPWAFCLTDGASEFRFMAYGGLLAFLLFAASYVLSIEQSRQGHDGALLFPNEIQAGLVAGIASTCLFCGLALIILAVNFLIFDFDPEFLMTAASFYSFCFAAPVIFVFFAVKPREQIAPPPSMRFILVNLLLPLYAMLILVLYAYLLKCIVKHNLPMERTYWFVSVAVAVYLYFYFTFKLYDGAAVTFFYKYGALFLAPLIVVQCYAFGRRIANYGYTPFRVAALYWIFACVCICALSLFKHGIHMMKMYLVLAALTLVATVGPLNILSVAARSQTARLESALKRNGMFEGGRIVPAAGEAAVSEPDKAAIISAVNELNNGRRPSYLDSENTWIERSMGSSEFKDGFAQTFGFAYRTDYGDDSDRSFYRRYEFHCEYDGSPKRVVTGDFHEMRYVHISNRDDGMTVALPDGGELDFTESLKDIARSRPERIDGNNSSAEDDVHGEEPLVLHKDGWTFYAWYMLVRANYKAGTDIAGTDTYWNYNMYGILCR